MFATLLQKGEKKKARTRVTLVGSDFAGSH